MSDDRELTGAEAIAALGEGMRRTIDPAVPSPAELIAWTRTLECFMFSADDDRLFSALLSVLEGRQTPASALTASPASVATGGGPDVLSRLRGIQQREHDRAVSANALFSVEHWKHNAGDDWPDTDDDSWQAFENCRHPDCLAVRDLAAPVPLPDAAITAVQPESPWRSIETYQKDEAPQALLYGMRDFSDGIVQGCWNRGDMMVMEHWMGGVRRPTHWMPLPDPPSSAGSPQERA